MRKYKLFIGNECVSTIGLPPDYAISIERITEDRIDRVFYPSMDKLFEDVCEEEKKEV